MLLNNLVYIYLIGWLALTLYWIIDYDDNSIKPSHLILLAVFALFWPIWFVGYDVAYVWSVINKIGLDSTPKYIKIAILVVLIGIILLLLGWLFYDL